MGFPRRPWTGEEIATLRARYATDTNDAIAADLERSRNSVQIAAKNLGLRKTREQVSLLRSKINFRGCPRAAALSDADAAYLAGIIDGEGCITACFGRTYDVQWSLTVCNTSMRLMEWLQARLDGKVHAKANAERRRRCYTWQIRGNRCVRDVLERVRPFLVIKAAQADLALTPHYSLTAPERQELLAKIRALNFTWRNQGVAPGLNRLGGRPASYSRG